ncbi:prolyl oligopeptidase family serine peptidase [Crateriforma spongiae]|uniref:prolyl oligopeptidase family serine peptidase n=1 Tax=Crateriforma spongiae TaxID=2724528 RepID=UPI001447CDE0|nr:prolyl oligopeptidase family serine peptidase [Crateriforma spongiae]
MMKCCQIRPQMPPLAWCLSCVVMLLAATVGNAQDKASSTTKKPTYKSLPPAGIAIDPARRDSLASRAQSLRSRLSKTQSAGDRAADAESSDVDWRPHVSVLIRAVDLALTQNLFFKPNQVDAADRLLNEAQRRLDAAASGDRGLRLLGWKPSRSEQPQPLVGGFVSRIDGTVQPFGIVVPAGFLDAADSQQDGHRMDVWLHGRGDTKTEIPFLIERMDKPGQALPRDAFVLHPFGRHCNAFKFAGETDVYEAIEAAERLVHIDTDRIAIRGFSMGGAGCWHFAVHDSTRWFAASPGAGFVDTLVYQGWGDQPPFELTPARRQLLNWYDVLPWAGNLRNTHVIAYSGEVDKQKQAADRVAQACKAMGFQWPYVIGAGMGHKIDPASMQQIESQLAKWADPTKQTESGLPPAKLDWTTYTLRYNRAGFLTVTGLQKHWDKSVVRTDWRTEDVDVPRLVINTDGVTAMQIDWDADSWAQIRSVVGRPMQVLIAEVDDRVMPLVDESSEPGFQASLWRTGGQWKQGQPNPGVLRKSPGLQGPIDDALTEKFVMVLPSRPAKHGPVQRWIDREIRTAQRRWREIMRGEMPVVQDTDVTDDMIRDCNLICFGDYGSNTVLRKISGRLPIGWNRDRISVGDRTFDASNHVAILCYPNPLNPDRYVVVNSGLTFRTFSNNSNSRQIAMLPDWAIGEIRPGFDDSILPAPIAAEGFFDESWQLAP